MNFSKDISLKKLNTFGVDVRCKLFHTVSCVEEAKKIIISKEFNENKYLILGGGSNLLFIKNFDGLIIKNEIKGFEILHEDKYSKTIKVGAGENWHKLVLWSVKSGLSGLENMALIPGNVGAAPIQNIGAYGSEVKDVIQQVRLLEIDNGNELTLNNENCEFEYRNSIFKKNLKNKVIITHVSFKLNKQPNNNTEYGDIAKEIKNMGEEVSTESICNAVIKIRERKLPNPEDIGNCGSFFKNPIISNEKFHRLVKKYPGIVGYELSDTETKIAAGWLIEKCGWKGYRTGDVGVHEKQALVLVNYKNGTGEEIISLAGKIQKSVHEKFDIQILPEVNIIG